MIFPPLTDVVHTISSSLDEVIAPKLTGLPERSALLTIKHMLRFVEVSLDKEGQVLFDELHRLKSLLADAATRLATVDECRDIVSAVRHTLAVERDPSVYPSFAVLAQEIGVLREHVAHVLRVIRALPATARSSETDAVVHSLREYIRWQIAEEAKVFEPSFLGHGARR